MYIHTYIVIYWRCAANCCSGYIPRQLALRKYRPAALAEVPLPHIADIPPSFDAVPRHV